MKSKILHEVLILSIILISAMNSYSWENEKTHPAITERADNVIVELLIVNSGFAIAALRYASCPAFAGMTFLSNRLLLTVLI